MGIFNFIRIWGLFFLKILVIGIIYLTALYIFTSIIQNIFIPEFILENRQFTVKASENLFFISTTVLHIVYGISIVILFNKQISNKK